MRYSMACETHAILLAHSIAYNAAAAPEGTDRVARAIGAEDAAQGMYQLAQRLGVPLGLKQIGVAESDLDQAVAIALEKPLSNPQTVDSKTLRRLLENAWHGRAPQYFADLLEQ